MRILFHCIAIVFLSLTYHVAPAQILFSEQAAALGCSGSSFGNGTLGGGISFFDFDNDGWDDITVSSEEGQPVRFYKNTEGTFTQVDLGIPDHMGEIKSVVWVDFDNDGDYDLYTSSNSDGRALYENDGALNFTDITVAAGLYSDQLHDWGASWGDYNNDGWLDLFQTSRHDGDASFHNKLYENNGDGTFTNVTSQSGLIEDIYMSFCASFFDYNNDGWQDIYIADDRPQFANLMYRNNGDGTYTEVGNSTGTDAAINAMSTAIGDYDSDGWFDIYVTNTPEGNVFYRNNGNNTFTDVAPSNGTLMETVAWGAVYLDADNDGNLDLYVSSSWTNPDVALTSAFYRNDGTGNYSIPENAGFENDDAVSFSNAIGDIDNDGYPDMVVLNFAPDDIYVWKNECPTLYNWIKVKLEGTESNRQGIGSVIEISVNGEKQYNYTLCGEGYLGQNSSYEFFGINDAESIDYIKVTWLSGIVDVLENPDINSHITILEGSTLGLETPDSSYFSLYPNPTSGILQLRGPKHLNTIKATISDGQGRVLISKTMDAQSGSLDMTGFSEGLYFVTLQNGSVTEVQKVILK
ncbi:FG-GAP-like repeat-containing protein [Aureisphaera galaxeae]|uniref:FG-GAP-like repeat-containing protein n=1 Tax=Aureisphaera galaxeae TaxID=1538023 RepID=UPI00234FE7C9|nr:FG-GAP-like repeat-containing protein [Aureisphaera galaxeae]MDC8005465.1 FG-GAP-like repeat-containing protein [Aureisphaera galaxeae]